MANFILGLISLTIGVIVLASVFITTVKDTNTSSFTAGEVAKVVTRGTTSNFMGTFDFGCDCGYAIRSFNENNGFNWCFQNGTYSAYPRNAEVNE